MPNWQSGALERNTPRTCTAEDATVAITADKQEVPTIYVADLAIDPVTGQADFSNSVPIVPQVDNSQLRESMQQLLDMILGFFEEEERRVDNGELKEEEVIFHDLQTDDTNTKHPIRQLPAGFDRRRA